MKLMKIFKKKGDVTSRTNTAYNKSKTSWKQNIPSNPTYEDFNNAWMIVFGYNFNDCVVHSVENGVNTGFTVETPKGICMNGGFGNHTETPNIQDPDDIYYSGRGCTWGIDMDDVRYHKLDKATNMPVYFEEACAAEIVRRYITNNQRHFQQSIESKVNN